MPKITVQLYIRRGPDGTQEMQSIEVPLGARLKDLLKQMNIAEVENLIPMVNGRRQPLTYRIEDGDHLRVFPLMAGG